MVVLLSGPTYFFVTLVIYDSMKYVIYIPCL